MGRIRLVRTDLSDESSLPAQADFAGWLADPEVDHVVFINNAFSDQPIGSVGALPAGPLLSALRTNVIAPVLLTNALMAVPAVAGGPLLLTVLNITAAVAKRPLPGWAVYAASKAGIEVFFDTLAVEHAGDSRITVHNVNPGAMDTPMQERIRSSAFPDRERFVALKENGQLASPAGVAGRIVAEYLGPHPDRPSP